MSDPIIEVVERPNTVLVATAFLGGLVIAMVVVSMLAKRFGSES